jgi:hypothetical protein
VIKTGQARAARATYLERMVPADFRSRVRECPNCGRLVRLNREGCYRRHYATAPDRRLHLCAASGHAAAELVPRGLSRHDP